MKRVGTRAYIKTLLKDPSVASITPTSNFGIKKLTSTVDFNSSKFFIEYGPGGGVITKDLLSRMAPDAQLLAIERNENFANSLKINIKDKRLIVVNESAENVLSLVESMNKSGVLKYSKADHVLSGIPFSLFPVSVKDAILDATRLVLKSNGSFLVYQFLISLSGGKNDIKRKIREYFEISRSEVELRNVPPLRIFEGSPRSSVKMEKTVKKNMSLSATLLSK